MRTGGRAVCYTCRRVERLCVCRLVRGRIPGGPLETRTGFTILQNRHEAIKRANGSAVIAQLALRNCRTVGMRNPGPLIGPDTY